MEFPNREEVMGLDSQSKLTEILIHMGETRNGISHLEKSVDKIGSNLTAVKDSTVKTKTCSARHNRVDKKLDKLGDSLEEVRLNVRSIKTATSEFRATTIPLLDESAEPTKKHKKTFSYWITLTTSLIAILCFLGTIFWGFVTLGRYAERFDTLNRETKADRKAFKKELKDVKEKRRKAHVQYTY